MLDNSWVLLGEEWANEIWQPDLYITNLKELKLAKFKSNTGNYILNFILKVLQSFSLLDKLEFDYNFCSTMGAQHNWKHPSEGQLASTNENQILL